MNTAADIKKTEIDSPQSLNFLLVLLRFSGVFFPTLAPLLVDTRPEMLKATPVVGLVGFLAIVGVLLFRQIAIYLVVFSWLTNCFAGILLCLLFTGFLHQPSVYLYYLFAVVLALAMTGTEFAGLFSAVRPDHVNQVRARLTTFNMAKVFGMAAGFLLACLLPGHSAAAVISKYLVFFVGVTMFVLSVTSFRLWIRQYHHVRTHDRDNDERVLSRTCTGGIMIIVDLMLFSFWYAYIPYRLHSIYAVPTAVVGLGLAIQACVHALSQPMWKRIAEKLHDFPAFCISWTGHLLLVIIITHGGFQKPTLLIPLFVTMGLVNSGTYITGGAVFYRGHFPSGRFSRIAFQQALSNVGKWCGASLAVWIISMMENGYL